MGTLFVLLLLDKDNQPYGEWHFPDGQIHCLTDLLAFLIDNAEAASIAESWCKKAIIGEEYCGEGFCIKVTNEKE